MYRYLLTLGYFSTTNISPGGQLGRKGTGSCPPSPSGAANDQLLFIKSVHKIRTFFVLKLNVKLLIKLPKNCPCAFATVDRETPLLTCVQSHLVAHNSNINSCSPEGAAKLRTFSAVLLTRYGTLIFFDF